jgi:hypothetical protein
MLYDTHSRTELSVVQYEIIHGSFSSLNKKLKGDSNTKELEPSPLPEVNKPHNRTKRPQESHKREKWAKSPEPRLCNIPYLICDYLLTSIQFPTDIRKGLKLPSQTDLRL